MTNWVNCSVLHAGSKHQPTHAMLSELEKSLCTPFRLSAKATYRQRAPKARGCPSEPERASPLFGHRYTLITRESQRGEGQRVGIKTVWALIMSQSKSLILADTLCYLMEIGAGKVESGRKSNLSSLPDSLVIYSMCTPAASSKTR